MNPQDQQAEQAMDDVEVEPLHDDALEQVAGGNMCSLTMCSNVSV
ncbi:MAG TPA: hypothetical protein VFE05_12740 [Longimicrobiaceae bacterium]|jgi:hypothetical protein|nr:hypothetical protein [Longimicrobiaceae bacterium]